MARGEKMRTITYGGAVSLDGFLAGVDGSIDWLHFSKDVQQVMTDYWKNVDTILMGRKTYDFAAANTPKKSEPRKNKIPGTHTYVFSRTLKKIDDPNVELVTGDAVDFIRTLKQASGKDICLMGGGELAQSLLTAGLVDRIGLNIQPILLGAGIPTFRDPGHRVKLNLIECRPLEGGCILAQYEVLQGGF
jgi:dihydrofolate reductase